MLELPGLLDETDLLIDLLNTTPVEAGTQHDHLADDRAAAEWIRAHDGPVTPEEVAATRRVRDVIQAVVRGEQSAERLAPYLADTALVPVIESERLAWRLRVDGSTVAARAVLAWGRVEQRHPGRLRPCANDECRLFLLDRSNANRAQWCSMAVCGNRMKARRNYRKQAGGS